MLHSLNSCLFVIERNFYEKKEWVFFSFFSFSVYVSLTFFTPYRLIRAIIKDKIWLALLLMQLRTVIQVPDRHLLVVCATFSLNFILYLLRFAKKKKGPKTNKKKLARISSFISWLTKEIPPPQKKIKKPL